MERALDRDRFPTGENIDLDALFAPIMKINLLAVSDYLKSTGTVVFTMNGAYELTKNLSKLQKLKTKISMCNHDQGSFSKSVTMTSENLSQTYQPHTHVSPKIVNTAFTTRTLPSAPVTVIHQKLKNALQIDSPRTEKTDTTVEPTALFQIPNRDHCLPSKMAKQAKWIRQPQKLHFYTNDTLQ